MQAPFNSLTGALPAGLAFDGASGNINPTASPLATSVAGTLVFSSSGGTSTGPIVCPDGSSSTWSSTVAAFTMAAAINPSLPGGDGNASGAFVLDFGIKACGSDASSQIVSGLITGNVPSVAGVTLVLHGPGDLLNGVARGWDRHFAQRLLRNQD